MGPKKKGKGSKLARMSEEERMRYLQHRAAIEEEARRRKEQLIATFMKNKLKREEAFSRLNMAKINQQWRQTLRVIKCTELKQDLEALYRWFDHTATKKTKLIESLLDDLEEAECQYSRIHQCHMETIDRLLLLYNQRINHLHRQYEDDRNEIYRKATRDITEIVHSATFDQEHLKSIIFRMEESFAENSAATNSQHLFKTDELRNNMLTALENLVNSREIKMEKIWQNLQAVLKHHWNQTEDRRRQYVTLRDADLENCRQIFLYYQQINSVGEIIASLREQLGKTDSANDDRFLECKADKENCNELFYVLRRKLVVEKEVDRRKLNFMTDSAETVTKDLKKTLSKGEQILQLISLCRKLETLNEKICPGGLDKSQLSEDQENAIKESFEVFDEPLAEEVFKKFSKLDGFWKKYNQVFLEKQALSLHYHSLLNEQKHLKSALRNYLSDFVIAQPSMRGQLMIHRPSSIRRTSSASETSKSDKRLGDVTTCVEGNQSPSIKHMINLCKT